MHKRVAICGKGGVGKTTLALNLAYALHKLDENVLLLDTNLSNAHIGLHLKESDPKATMHDVLVGKAPAKNAIQTHPSGLKYVTGAIDAPKIHNLNPLNKFGKAAEWIIKDADSTDNILEHADQIILVANPTLPSLADTLKLLHKAQKKQLIIAGILLNNHDKKGLSREEMEKFLGMSFSGTIPKDEYIHKAMHDQHIYAQQYTNRVAAQNIFKIAARLSNKPF